MPERKLNERISRDVLRKIREFAQEDPIKKKWEDTPYGEIQQVSNPKKGLLGEHLVAMWLEDTGYLSEGRGYARQRGGNNFDISVLINDNLERVEVKLATQDSSDKYQFNWISLKQKPALVVFVGIDPDSIHLSIKTWSEIMRYKENPTRGRTLTPVPQGKENPTHVKWTASKESAGLVEIKTLGDVADLFQQAIGRLSEDGSFEPTT